MATKAAAGLAFISLLATSAAAGAWETVSREDSKLRITMPQMTRVRETYVWSNEPLRGGSQHAAVQVAPGADFPRMEVIAVIANHVTRAKGSGLPPEDLLRNFKFLRDNGFGPVTPQNGQFRSGPANCMTVFARDEAPGMNDTTASNAVVEGYYCAAPGVVLAPADIEWVRYGIELKLSSSGYRRAGPLPKVPFGYFATARPGPGPLTPFGGPPIAPDPFEAGKRTLDTLRSTRNPRLPGTPGPP